MKTAFLGMALVLARVQDGAEQILPLKVGSVWEYKGKKSGKPANEKWEITKTEKKGGNDCFLLRMTGGDQSYGLYVRITQEGVRIEDAGLKQISDEERYLLKFPLDPGAKASIFFSAPDPAVVEEKTEEINVPAGKFTCVVLKDASAIPGLGKMTHRQWIARGTGFVKSETVWVRENNVTSTDTMELEKYSPGK